MMEMWQVITICIAAAGLLLNVGIAIVGATWGVARIRMAVAEEVAKHRADFEVRMDALENSTGQTVLAIRTKVHEVELWIRDNFVRRDSFTVVITEVREGFAAVGRQIDRRLERIENRLYGGSGEPG